MLLRQDRQPTKATAKVIDLRPRLADSYRGLVENLETAALADIVNARRTLKRLIDTARVKRQEKTGYAVGEVDMKTARLLSETGPLVSMVAGAGSSLYHACAFS